MIIVYLLVLVTGFYALVKGADMFVDGSSNIARMLHVPGLIIGLTIVAFGTSAPELAVSTSAALQGANEIAVSNVVGSNLFNLLVVLGICAVLKPIAVDRDVLRRDYPVSLGITGLALAITCESAFVINRGPQYMLAQGTSLLSTGERFLGIDMSQIVGTVSRIDGLVLVIMLVLYIGLLIISSLRGAAEEEEPQEAVYTARKAVGVLLIGLALIIIGGQAVVNSARAIARALGMTETLIGLTIVAFGTSLPELVTSIVASRKGEVSMAVGNVIGSNIFNVLLILGISSVLHPITINAATAIDMALLICVSFVVYFFCVTDHKISRLEGALMLCMYCADMAFAIIR